MCTIGRTQLVHGFRCYGNIHVCNIIALYTANSYGSAEREMSASACARCTLRLQFVQRVLVMLMPAKYQPDYMFLRNVPMRRVHLFTVIQLACIVVLCVIKELGTISIVFPVMVCRVLALTFSQAPTLWGPEERKESRAHRWRPGSRLAEINVVYAYSSGRILGTHILHEPRGAHAIWVPNIRTELYA